MKIKMLVLFSLVLGLTACFESDEERTVRICQDGKTAYPNVTKLISQRLVAPKSAEYPSFEKVRHKYLGQCRHRFVGHLDSQNRAGAMLRLNYTVIVKANPANGQYSVESLDMNQW